MMSLSVGATVAIIAVVTFLTRALPFLIFPDNRRPPAYIRYLGSVLPFAVMGMLVVYCLKSVSLLSFPYAVPEGIAILYVVLIHRKKHNLALSIGGGTLLYMFLVQVIFPG